MQRSRRRKLLRAAKRDPRYLMAVRGRDHLRHVAYKGVNRATRRSLAAGAIEPTQRNALREAYGQIRAALR
jgi:hypothetical protein